MAELSPSKVLSIFTFLKPNKINRFSASGAALHETILTIGVFFIIIYSFFSIGIHIYRRVALQYAVNSAARWAGIGNVMIAPSGKRVDGAPIPHTTQMVIDYVVNQATSLGVPLNTTNVSISMVCLPGQPITVCNPNITLSPGTSIPEARYYKVSALHTDNHLLGLMSLSVRCEAVGVSES
jgi:hypothetical protein